MGNYEIYELPAHSSAISDVAAVGAQSNAPAHDSKGDLFYSNYLNNTVYEIPSGSHTPSVVAVLGGNDGSAPVGNLYFDSAGNLYGTCAGGGVGGYGTVFKIDALTHAVGVLASFNKTNGALPNSLVFDSTGDIFGTTDEGGLAGQGSLDVGFGTVFEIPAGTNNVTTLHFFNEGDGLGAGDLTVDAAGNLYGETVQGGGDGNVFELSTSSSVPEPLNTAMLTVMGGAMAVRRRAR